MDEEARLENIRFAVRVGIISTDEGVKAIRAVKEENYAAIKELYIKRTNKNRHGAAERP